MAKLYSDPGRALDVLQGVAQASNIVGNSFQRLSMTEYNSAITQMNTDLTNLTNEMISDNDVATMIDRFKEQAAEIQAGVEERIHFGPAKRMFTDAWGTAYSKALGQVARVQNEKSEAFQVESTVTDLQNIISTAPQNASGLSASEQFEAQKGRIGAVIENAVAAGMDMAQAENLRRQAVSQLSYSTSRDLAYKAIDKLSLQGFSLDEASEIVEKAITLEGAEYQEYLKSLEIVSASPELMALAEAYGNVNLTPDQEEQLRGEIFDETTRRVSRRQRDRTIASTEYQQTLSDIILKEDGWKRLSADNYGLIGKDDILSPDEQLYWRNLVDNQRETARQLALQAERDEQERQENSRWQTTDQKLEQLYTNPTTEGIAELRKQVLAEPDDTARRIRLQMVRTIESQLEYDNAQRAIAKAENEAARADAAREAADARKELDYNRMLRAYDVSIDSARNDKDMLEALKEDIFEDELLAEEEQDRNERISLINRYLDVLAPGRVDPSKSDPEVIREVMADLTNGSISDQDYQKKVLEYMSLGELSGQDAYTWYNRGEKMTRAELLNDSTALNAYTAISTYFDGRMQADLTPRESAFMVREYNFALKLWNTALQDPETRNLSPKEREAAFDDLVDTIVDRMSVFQILGINFGDEISLDSLESFEALRDSGRVEEAEQVAQTLQANWEEDFWSDQVVGGEYRPSDFEWVNRGGNIVYRNKQTGMLYTKMSRSDAGKAVQYVFGILGGQNDPARWYYARPSDVVSGDDIEWHRFRGQME